MLNFAVDMKKSLNMKRYLLLILCVSAFIAASALNIVLRSSAGQQSFSSADVEKIELSTAGGASLYLNGVAEPVIISAADFRCIAFSESNSLGSVAADSNDFVIEGNMLRTAGKVDIYDVNGAHVATSENGEIDLSPFHSGVYVISNGKNHTKIYLK